MLFLSEQRVAYVRLSLTVACVFASLMNWERFSRIKNLPIPIHNMGNQGSRRFFWPWRRFCSLFIEGLSDRGAADAVRGRIDW
ncbi:MAG TPA: hypothetical protein VG324_12985, partial [Blastocatellia bacterium]|nr:hypothetical protein [Blastocatellia bacterium]